MTWQLMWRNVRAAALNTTLQLLVIYRLVESIIIVGTLPQLIGFIRFGEPVPHGLSARHRVWAGPTKG